MRRFDVLILGAGIVGCACALECMQAGLRVGIVERDVPGGAATAAGMGHIVVMDDSPAQLSLTRYSRSLWQELQPQLPILGLQLGYPSLVIAKGRSANASAYEPGCAGRRACDPTPPVARSSLIGGVWR